MWISKHILIAAKVLIENGYLPNVSHTGDPNWKRMFVIDASDGSQIGQLKFNKGELTNYKPHNVPAIRQLPVWEEITKACYEMN